MKNTFTVNGSTYHIRDIQSIGPVRDKHENLDGFYGIFMKSKKLSYDSWTFFEIYLKNYGWISESSKIDCHQGMDNFHSDKKIHDKREEIVEAWENYKFLPDKK